MILLDSIPAPDPEAPPGDPRNMLHHSTISPMMDPESYAFLTPPGGESVWGRNILGSAFHEWVSNFLSANYKDADSGKDHQQYLAELTANCAKHIEWSESTGDPLTMLTTWVEVWKSRYFDAVGEHVSFFGSEVPMLWRDELTGLWYETTGVDSIWMPATAGIFCDDWKTGTSIPTSLQAELVSLMVRHGWAGWAPFDADTRKVDWTKATPVNDACWLDPDMPTFGEWPMFRYIWIDQMCKGVHPETYEWRDGQTWVVKEDQKDGKGGHWRKVSNQTPWIKPYTGGERQALNTVRKWTRVYLDTVAEAQPTSVSMGGNEVSTNGSNGNGDGAVSDLLQWGTTDDQGKRTNILIYGDPGAGKTTLCQTFGVDPSRTVYVGVDPGQKVLEGSGIRTLGPTRKQLWLNPKPGAATILRAIYGEVMKNVDSIDLLFIDGLDELGEAVLIQTKADPENKHGQQAYGAMGDIMIRMTKAFRDIEQIPLVVFTSHIEWFQDDSSRVYFMPSFPGRQVSKQLMNWWDMVGCLRVEGGERALQFDPAIDDRYRCKYRSRHQSALAGLQPPNMELVLKRVHEGAEAEIELTQEAV